MNSDIGDSPPALTLDGVRFCWPKAHGDVLAIDRLHIRRGERVMLRGDSGCGKSTLLSLAAGVLVPQTGQVRLLGSDWRGLSAGRRDRVRADHIGYIFQLLAGRFAPRVSGRGHHARLLRALSLRRPAGPGAGRRTAVFAVQRRVAEYEAEPLLAVLPGVALDELWDAIGAGERAVLVMSALAAVLLAGTLASLLPGWRACRISLADGLTPKGS